MMNYKTIAKLPRLILMMTAGVILFATTDAALAKNSDSHNDHNDSGKSNSSFSRKSDNGDKDKHKDKDKYSDKDKCKNAAPGTCGTDNIHPIPSPPAIAETRLLPLVRANLSFAIIARVETLLAPSRERSFVITATAPMGSRLWS